MPWVSCRGRAEGCRRAEVTAGLAQPPGPARGMVRHGHARDTGTDAAPVPQYLNRAG